MAVTVADCQLEAALPTEVDIEQRDIRLQLGGLLQGLSTGRRHADDQEPLAFQQATGGSPDRRRRLRQAPRGG